MPSYTKEALLPVNQTKAISNSNEEDQDETVNLSTGTMNYHKPRRIQIWEINGLLQITLDINPDQ